MADEKGDFEDDWIPQTGPVWEEAGAALVPLALTSLYPALPELLYVLYDPEHSRYCYRKLTSSEDCGLLCFVDTQHAYAFMRTRPSSWPYVRVENVTLDYAHAMARERHAVVNCLILVDQTFSPSVYHVK